MANAAQPFDDIARCSADGEERHHLEFLAAEYRRCEEARKALIDKIRRQTPTVLDSTPGYATPPIRFVVFS